MVRSMFKVNNKDTRTTSVTSFWCLYCQFWTYFTPFFSVSTVDVQQVIVCWVFSSTHIIQSTPVFSNPNPLISIAISIPIGFDFFMGHGNETLFWNGLKKACRASIYLLKFNNRNTRMRCEICSKLTPFTPCSSVSITNFDHAIFRWVVNFLIYFIDFHAIYQKLPSFSVGHRNYSLSNLRK